MLAQRDQRIRYPKAMFYTNPKILKSLKLKRMASRLTLGYGFLQKKTERNKNGGSTKIWFDHQVS